jgi:hypothetical protein
MKRKVLFVLMLLWIIPFLVFSVQAGAQSSAKKNNVSSATDKNFRSFMEGEKARHNKDTGSLYYYASPLKEAQLSYQASLTLPVKGSYACKNETQLRVLAGMHGFDINYALVFGRKQEFVKTMRFLNSEILGRLKNPDYINPNVRAVEDAKALLTDMKDPQNIENFKMSWSKQFEANMQKAKADPKVMQQLIDQSYGAIIESSYILCNLALSGGSGDKLYALFIDYMLRVDALDIKMREFYNSPYGKALGQSDRKNIFPPILDIIEKKHGLLDRKDIKSILAIVKKARAEYVTPCR